MIPIDLIQKCKQKDAAAEKQLFLSTAPLVMSICRRYASSETEAKDFLQESFIQIFEKIHTYKKEKGAFKSWMCKVSINIILMHLRKKKNTTQLVYLDFLPDKIADESIIDSASLNQIVLAIQKLPPGYRKVFNLSVVEGWSHEDIGIELNIKASTSRSQLTRAKELIKRKLSQKLNETYAQRMA